MKDEAGTLNATPQKRLFLSIIADYNLKLAICELIDNVLDLWLAKKKDAKTKVTVSIDVGQQSMTIKDNAGGIAEDDLELIVAPGQTQWGPTSSSIGIFGVGSKRAVVHLAQDVEIRTRRPSSTKTFQIEFDDAWIKDSEDWRLKYYKVDKIAPGTTIISLSRLRSPVSDSDVQSLREHVAATYAEFLETGRFEIEVSPEQIAPRKFDNWAYPPTLEPKEYCGELTTADGAKVKVRVKVGLMGESSPVGDWGLYFYCNGRLIASALKDPSVGFESSLIGRPHPDISLLRAEFHLNGPVDAMPWNSTKSGVSVDHRVFQSLRQWSVPILKEWASVSRKLSGDWESKVFAFKTGTSSEIAVETFGSPGRSHLPDVASARPSAAVRLKAANRKLIDDKPWVTGLIDGAVAAKAVRKLNLESRNRLALIILDSTFEIAMKEYLVNDSGHHYTDPELVKLFQRRHDVQLEFSKYVNFDPPTWGKLNYYYNLRCKLIHERVSIEIRDEDVDKFGRLVENCLRKMYGARFKA